MKDRFYNPSEWQYGFYLTILFLHIWHMTPEKRLNQIEPELAEVIQKVDRLIESNGQILELAVNTKAELTEVKEIVGGLKDTVSTIETTIGDLKTDVSDLKTDVGDLKTDVSDLKITVRNLEGTAWGLKEAVEKVEISGNSTARAVANLTVSTGHQFDELKASQVRLEETQQEILSFLRNKFN